MGNRLTDSAREWLDGVEVEKMPVFWGVSLDEFDKERLIKMVYWLMKNAERRTEEHIRQMKARYGNA